MKNVKKGFREIIEIIENMDNGYYKQNFKYIDKRRTYFFELLKLVNIDKKLFLKDIKKKEYSLYVDDVKMIFNHNYINIRRELHNKYELVDKEALMISVLFFCSFLENYVNDDNLLDEQIKVCERLGFNYDIENNKLENIRYSR